MKPRSATGLIALLTDFGTRDWYVATLKAVILSRAPTATLVDITHEIPPQDVVAGAFTLAAVAPWFPRGTVFLAVVDPGVGSDRALLAVHADGYYFVGPDNGLLALSLQHLRRPTIIQLTQRRYWMSEISHTFHGRDIMAPIAAHLARGRALTSLGRPLRHVTPLPLPTVQHRGRKTIGHIIHLDVFGNLITNLTASLITMRGQYATPTLRYQHHTVRVVSSYAAGHPNELIGVVGSLGLVELAIQNGSAAWTFNARRGDEVTLLE